MCESKPGIPNPVPLTPETYSNQAHPDNDVEHIANVDGDNKVSEQAIQHGDFGAALTINQSLHCALLEASLQARELLLLAAGEKDDPSL